jgi:hypothetical protein
LILIAQKVSQIFGNFAALNCRKTARKNYAKFRAKSRDKTSLESVSKPALKIRAQARTRAKFCAETRPSAPDFLSHPRVTSSRIPTS